MNLAPVRSKVPRYHSLDRLCALMMLLGLVLHTAISYFPFPVQETEQVHLDPLSSPFFDYLVTLIPSFRVPVFFVIARFFAAFLLGSRAPAAFIRHRGARTRTPLMGAWVVIHPVTAVSRSGRTP